jgi:putative NIF3 family GTP cyclohydrolase 1 type 2
LICLDPIIFRGLKALTLDDPQQATLLKLCAKGIGVYSPHTSVDGAAGGVNDWLASIVADKDDQLEISPIICPSVTGIPKTRRGKN